MKSRTSFIIFAHSTTHTIEDIDDIINNISHFHNNCDFMVNHPTLNHPKIRIKHMPGQLNVSNFIFGALIDLIKNINEEEINSFDHFCLVSANQYFINDIDFKKGVNYAQFLNTENWEQSYNGKDFDKTIVGFPLQQPYGRWDNKDLYKEFNIELPMSANWECLTFTKEVMLLAKKHIDKCLEYYPNDDMMNIFLPYMILLSKQPWEFPAYFGTYDPSNKPNYNWVITINQIVEKYNQGYFSVKRVNYPKDCELKQFIRQNYMK
jgi:DNA-directed RNA polymerase subunit L